MVDGQIRRPARPMPNPSAPGKIMSPIGPLKPWQLVESRILSVAIVADAIILWGLGIRPVSYSCWRWPGTPSVGSKVGFGDYRC